MVEVSGGSMRERIDKCVNKILPLYADALKKTRSLSEC